jgi:toxin ParE1/3/4
VAIGPLPMCAHSMRLEITPGARADISDILLFTEQRWGRQQRDGYRRLLDATFRRLVAVPGMGRSVGELSPGLHRVNVESHIIYYWVDDDRLTIARVLHYRRDPYEVEWQSPSEED